MTTNPSDLVKVGDTIQLPKGKQIWDVIEVKDQTLGLLSDKGRHLTVSRDKLDYTEPCKQISGAHRDGHTCDGIRRYVTDPFVRDVHGLDDWSLMCSADYSAQRNGT